MTHSYTYSVKVRSAHQISGAPVQYLPLEDLALQPDDPQNASNPALHRYATYLWGGGGLFFYDYRQGTTQHAAVSPVEFMAPRSQALTIHVDVDGCPIELYAATFKGVPMGYDTASQPVAKGLFYLGQLRPGQVATFRLGGLHGIAAVCNDPSGSDSKVTCVLVTDPAP